MLDFTRCANISFKSENILVTNRTIICVRRMKTINSWRPIALNKHLNMLIGHSKRSSALLSLHREGLYQEKVNLPRYLSKDGYFPLIIPIRKRQRFPGQTRRRDAGSVPHPVGLPLTAFRGHNLAKDNWEFKIPTSRKYAREKGAVYITVAPNLKEHRIKEIRILPKQKGRISAAAFIDESQDEPINVDSKNAISIDLGLNNLATVVSTTDESLIIEGGLA